MFLNWFNDHSGCGLSQWEKALHSNAFSHWLSPYPEWSLLIPGNCDLRNCYMSYMIIMMTSWHGNTFHITGPLWGESIIHHVESHHKWPAMWSFVVFFDVSLNKLLNNQSSCWWFEMPWCSCVICVMMRHASQQPLLEILSRYPIMLSKVPSTH